MKNIARDHGVGLAALESFVVGDTLLSPEVLTALAVELFGSNVIYDPVIDRLRRSEPPTTPAPIYPPSLAEQGLLGIRHYGGPPHSDKPEPQQPRGPKPGWAT